MARTARGASCGIALAICALAGITSCSTEAFAEPTAAELQQASAHFQKGKAAFDRKHFAEAARSFEAAFATVPDTGTAFNAAVAWESAKDPARAADAYVMSLDHPGLDPARASDAQSALERLEADLTRVVVRTTSPARVTLAYRTGQSPLVVHPTRGRHEIVVEFSSGARTTRTIDVGTSPLVLELDAPLSVRDAAPVVEPPAPEEPDPGFAQRVVGIVALGLSGAAGGAAIGLGVKALETRDAFDDGGNTDAELRDEAANLRIATNVAWGIAGAFAVTGVVLIATSYGGEDAETSTTAGLCVGPTRVALCGAF